MMQKAVMFITNSGGGLFKFRYEIIKKMRDDGYDVFLVYPNGDRKEEFEKSGCHYIDVPFDSSSTNPFGDIVLYRRFRKVIKQIRPNVALLYTIKPCIYAGYALRRMQIPYICTVTGISPALMSNKWYIRFISNNLSRIGYNGSSIVYFQNSMNEEMFTKLRIAQGKHQLIAGSGVNLEKFKPMDYPIDDGYIKLLYVGRLKKIKGVEELARAVARANGEGLKIKCRVVGKSGDDMPDFSKAVDDGIIEYDGFTNDVTPYIAWCDALVLPSYGEGMSNVLQEASACARPILASEIPGCKEIYDEGITGLGFKPKDEESLLGAIKKFYASTYDERKMMGVKAREKMERDFDRKKIVSIYSETVNELVGGNV